MNRVAIYLVTYRRPGLMRRALASVLAQTHRDILVRVVNDDPVDAEPGRIVAETGDPRATLFQPLAHRGGAANFNLMCGEAETPFVSILEDDNWWEPRFLETMLTVLAENPGHDAVAGNQQIWKETSGGDWLDTGRTVWPFHDTREHTYSAEDICGSTKIPNSALLIRLGRRVLHTPDAIPIDVTEHYRERLLGPTLLMVGHPLVNYAATVATYRSVAGPTWGLHQTLLIGSVFAATSSMRGRRRLAEALWRDCPSPTSPRATILVATGVAVAEARSLIRTAPPAALARSALWAARRPLQAKAFAGCRRSLATEFAFLTQAPLTRHLAAKLES